MNFLQPLLAISVYHESEAMKKNKHLALSAQLTKKKRNGAISVKKGASVPHGFDINQNFSELVKTSRYFFGKKSIKTNFTLTKA